MTIGKQWKDEELPLGAVRALKDFQFRLDGVDPANVQKIMRTLEAGGETRDPIKVARVGKVLYMLDGFHRLEAYRMAGKRTIPAQVAKMSLPEALDYARGSNTMNGKPYSRADRQALLRDYVGRGQHLHLDGSPKSCREIAADPASGGYSYETVRKKLNELGVELDEATEYPGGYKPQQRDTEEDLLADLAEDAETCLVRFGEVFHDLPIWQQENLLRAVKDMVALLERGERPDMPRVLEQSAAF